MGILSAHPDSCWQKFFCETSGGKEVRMVLVQPEPCHHDSALQLGCGRRRQGLQPDALRQGWSSHMQHTHAHCVFCKGLVLCRSGILPTHAWQGLLAAVHGNACSAERLACNQSA